MNLFLPALDEPGLMDTTDRLIEYYFQRKINGMTDSEIQKSLNEQFMEDEDQGLIFQQVQYREVIHRKMLARKRNARNTMLVGLGLILAAIAVFLVTLINHPFPYSIHIFYTLLSLGFTVFLAGMGISRK